MEKDKTGNEGEERQSANDNENSGDAPMAVLRDPLDPRLLVLARLVARQALRDFMERQAVNDNRSDQDALKGEPP